MFKKLLRIFSRGEKKTEEVAPCSIMLGGVSIPVSSKRKACPEIDAILESVEKNGSTISNEGLNKLAAFYFNVPEIKPGLFKINQFMFSGMNLIIRKIETNYDSNDDVSDIEVTLVDNMYESSVEIKLSIKDFHEFMEFFDLSDIRLGKESTKGK